MNRFLTILFAALTFSLLSLTAAAQNASIRGNVADKATGRNIAGAKVFLLSNGKLKKQTVTDASGNYVLDSLPYGTFDLECNNPAYNPQRFVGLLLKTGSMRLAYFKLTYNPEQLNSKKKRGAKDDIELIFTQSSLEAKQTAESTLSANTGGGEQQLDVPNTGYLISRDEILQRGYQYLFDVLEDIPEFEIQEKVHPEINNIVASRGVAGSGRWLIMQDGVRINSMIGSDIVISQNISVHAAKTIEIIMGASSAVYGADAFSGVINIVTFKGDELNSLQVQGSYGSYGTTDNTFLQGYGNKNKGFVIHSNYYRSNEPYMPKFYPAEYGWFDSLYTTNNQVMTSPFSTTDTTNLATPVQPYNISTYAFSFALKFHYKNLELGIITNTESHSSSTGYNYKYTLPIAGSQYMTGLNNIYLKHLWTTDKLSLQSSIQWNYYIVNPKSKFQNVYSAYQQAYKFSYEQHVLLRENFNYKFNEKHNLSAGFSFQSGKSLAKTTDLLRAWDRDLSAEEQGQYYIGTDIVTYTGDSLKIPVRMFEETRVSTGLFLQYHANLFDNKLLLTIGNRVDYIYNYHPFNNDTQAQSFLTNAPRLGVVYKPNPNFRIKFSFSTGVLTPPLQKTNAHYGSFSPSLDSLGRIVGLQPNFWRLPTPTNDANKLRPEYARSLELSTSYTRNDFFISANGYFNFLNNLYQSEIKTNLPFVEGDNSLIVPVAEISTSSAYGYVYGGMLRIDYRTFFDKAHNAELRTGISYAYVNGSIKDINDSSVDKTPFYNAPHTIKANLMFRYKKYSTSLRFIYRTKTVNEGFDTGLAVLQFGNEPFLLVNLFAQGQVFETKNKRFRIDAFVRVRNVLNSRYYNAGQPVAAQLQAVPQDPIRIVGGLQFYIK
jgi:iron complex outermembrane receptor protein